MEVAAWELVMEKTCGAALGSSLWLQLMSLLTTSTYFRVAFNQGGAMWIGLNKTLRAKGNWLRARA